MRVAIDCRSLRKSPSGISNFLITTINSITHLQPTWQFFLLSNESFHEEHLKNLVLRDNVRVILCPIIIFRSVAFIWLLFKIRNVIKKLKPDLYWSPAFLLPPLLPRSVKSLVTVHDLVFKNYKETMSFFDKVYAWILYDFSINRASLLWANSNYTKEEIEKYYPKRNAINIFAGFYINSDLFKPTEVLNTEREVLLNKFNLQQQFILFVGTIEPRKNLPFLLSLMPDLAASGFSLLIIGVKGWGRVNIENLIKVNNYPKEKISFAGFVTSEELVKIYNLASIYISTSLNEGFGMPQLEAMSCGCPVVSSHNSAMIEVVEGAGETVKSWDKKDWINTINKVYDNREKYIQNSINRSKEYKKENIINNLTKFIKDEI